MTSDKDFKRQVRARMKRTGENYTEARQALEERKLRLVPSATKEEREAVLRGWMEDHDVGGELIMDPTDEQLHLAAEGTELACREAAVQSVRRTALDRVLVEHQVSEELPLRIGVGIERATGQEGLFVADREQLPLFWTEMNAHDLGEPERGWRRGEEELSTALHWLGVAYRVSDADNGLLSLSEADPLELLDSGVFPWFGLTYEVRMQTDHCILNASESFGVVQEAVIVGVDDAEETGAETSALLVVEADDLYLGMASLHWLHAAMRFDQLLGETFGEVARYRVAMALATFSQIGITALPLAAVSTREADAGQWVRAFVDPEHDGSRSLKITEVVGHGPPNRLVEP